MSANRRNEIREATVDALAGLAGGRVSASRVWSFDTLPALNVVTAVESAGPGSMDDDEDLREVTIVVEARVLSPVGDASLLDALCLDVEQAVASDAILDGLTEDLHLAVTEYDLEGDETIHLKAEISFVGLYGQAPAIAPLVAPEINSLSVDREIYGLVFFFDLDREATSQIKIRPIVDDVPGEWIISPSVIGPQVLNHVVRIAALSEGTRYEAAVKLVATEGPSADWAPLVDGDVGPFFGTTFEPDDPFNYEEVV